MTKKRRRDFVAAAKAHRNAVLEAHARRSTSDLELKVVNAVALFTSSFGHLEDRIELDRLAAVVYAVARDEIKPWHRNNVNAAGKRLREAGILVYEARQGRPRKDDGSGGPTVRIGFRNPAETHPVAAGLFGEKVTPGRDEKRSGNSRPPDEKVTPPQRETHSAPGVRNAHSEDFPETSLSPDQKIRDTLRLLGRSPEAIAHAMKELGRRRDVIRDPESWALATAANEDLRLERQAQESDASEAKQKLIDQCAACDVHGWLLDDEGDPIEPIKMCSHRVEVGKR